MSQLKYHGPELFGGWVVSVISTEPYLYMHFRMGVHVVKQTLVVVVLLVPLQGLVITEVIAKRDQQYLAAEQLRLLAILVQKEVSPGGEKKTTITITITKGNSIREKSIIEHHTAS